MSKKQQRILLPASLIAFIVLTALAFAAPGKLRRLSVD
jgi:small neutral amino acid transporter SnatA (MarC family)